MKVLYANPIFLNYRLPYYKKLNELFNGEFYIMYSVNRYKNRYDKLLEEIKKVMGKNALPYTNELLYNTYEHSFKKYNIEKGKKIPFTRGLIKEIRRIKPDVLITEGFYQWTPLLILYSIIHRKPLFMGYERTLHTERNCSILKKLHRKITNLFISGYLVNGSETEKYLLSLGVSKEKIHIGGMSADSRGLMNSISLLSVEDKNKFKSLYNKPKGIIYLFSGQIVKRKGLDYLLKAWEKHIKIYSNDTLIIIGFGDLYAHFKDKYKEFDSIFFEGRIDYCDVYKYYAIADVFILPTIEDNWSLVIPEAMACGIPVATSIYNGCYPELVKKDINGYVFDTFKQKTILDALDYFHHVDLKEFGKKSIELEKPFNTDNCAQRTYDAIISTLKKQKK